MKQYRLFMLLASVFLLEGLNSRSHEEFSESTLQEKGLPLSLNVISDSYAPTGVENTGTRTSEEDYITRFTFDDRIGILQIITPDNGEKQYKNYCCTVGDDGNWSSDQPLIHQSGNVSYIAYYPYQKVNDEAELNAYLANFTPLQDQSTPEGYTNSDLMQGEGIVSNTTLTVTLQHLMALIVVEVQYPSDLAETSPVVSWEDGKIPYPVVGQEGVFRYLVKPNVAISLEGGYPYYSGTQKFKIQAEVSELLPAQYLLYKVDAE